MKIPNNINETLSGVPIEKRVFIYDATIIIEFLQSTFMPLPYHITPDALKSVGAGHELSKKDLKDSSKYDALFLSLYKLYEYYQAFREHRPYTTPIESRYKFSIIIKKLLLPKNGWQFEVRRVGRAQLIYVGPCELRAQATPEMRQLYPVPSQVKVETVNVGTKDLQDSTMSETEAPTKPDEVIDPTLT